MEKNLSKAMEKFNNCKIGKFLHPKLNVEDGNVTFSKENLFTKIK